MVKRIKYLEKYMVKKLIMKKILLKINIFLLPNFSIRIPVNKLPIKTLKEYIDNVRPILSNLILKSLTNMGINGPTKEEPKPIRNNCINKNGDIFFITY